jgi:hypothetical protein
MNIENNSSKKSNIKSNETDLLDVVVKLYNVLKRNILIIIIALVLGGLYYGYQYYKQKDFYKSSFIVDIDNEYLAIAEDIFLDLNTLVKNNKPVASKKLGINPSVLKKIIDMEFKYEFPENESIETPRVNFNIIHMPMDTIKTLENSIENYFNNIPYFKTRIKQRQLQIKQSIQEIEAKSKEADSLQKIFMESYLKNNKLIYINESQSQAMLQQFKLEMIEKKHELENELENVNILYIIESTTTIKKASLKSLSNILLVMVVMDLFFIFFIEINRIGKKK